jgi:glycosyltransferase 2 family protein
MKRTLLATLKFVITAGLIWVFLSRIEWAELRSTVSSARPELLALAVALFAASNLLGALQWGQLLRAQDIVLPFRTVVSLYFVGVFFNNFLISNIGGDAVRIYDLKRITGKGLSGFAATFLDRFVGLFTLICFSTIAYAGSPHLWGMALWIPILVLGLMLLGVLCFGFSRRLSSLMIELGGRILPERAVGLMNDVREVFLLYRHAYGLLLRVAILAVGVQLSRVAVYYTVGHALGEAVGFATYVVFIPLIAIVAAIPISFGGIGVRENMGVILFGSVGMAAEPALAVMFLGYLAGIVASIAGGVTFVLGRAASAAGPDGSADA